MVSLDWRVESRAGISLVELTLTNPAEIARRVRIANRLNGAVWPPRREGVPEAGWDDGGFEGVLAPAARRALGYASPAPVADPPAEPPAEVVWTERAGASEGGNSPDSSAVEATPEGVIRALGDARPPTDAVPRPPADAVPRPGSGHGADRDARIPDPVESWLSAVEERAERGGSDLLESEDRDALQTVARRAETLSERAASAARSDDSERSGRSR